MVVSLLSPKMGSTTNLVPPSLACAKSPESLCSYAILPFLRSALPMPSMKHEFQCRRRHLQSRLCEVVIPKGCPRSIVSIPVPLGSDDKIPFLRTRGVTSFRPHRHRPHPPQNNNLHLILIATTEQA
jgi:hypothetical protein